MVSPVQENKHQLQCVYTNSPEVHVPILLSCTCMSTEFIAVITSTTSREEYSSDNVYTYQPDKLICVRMYSVFVDLICYMCAMKIDL